MGTLKTTLPAAFSENPWKTGSWARRFADSVAIVGGSAAGWIYDRATAPRKVSEGAAPVAAPPPMRSAYRQPRE